ncbi:MAG: SWF/SNF helicase family protein, partial [Gammaproteobacteria bacterium]|nr:SWF/SNF helicase family protein [Gammaproteobacteria bacterium]
TAAILNSLDFDFFELLDSVTIARSRKHIETFYDTADIGQFPERLKPLSYRCPLTHRGDVIGFNEIFNRLTILKLSVYAPISYILPSRIKHYEERYDTLVEGGKSKFRQADREQSLKNLMTVNLLKRLESSVAAFRITLQGLLKNHTATLERIERYLETGSDTGFADVSAAFEEVDFDEDDFPTPGDATIGKKIQIKLADMDLPSWQHDLNADLVIIESLLEEMDKINPAEDAKLQHLKAHIHNKLANPLNSGNKKVLIFTAFADTANYLYDNLAASLQRTHQLHTARVSGGEPPKSTLRSSVNPKQGFDFQSVLTLFSPRSKEKRAILPNEPGEIDILIGTDCISEGQNLQDCDYLINYDIHWNPVRIIQRFGRVDRIGSQNRVIQLVNYWPDITLDEYINLKERVENRMVIADVVATGDDNVLVTQSHDAAYRKEQLRRLQEEVIEMEDLKTGVAITDLGLNDFRMDLLNHIKANGDLASVPNGLHAVVRAAPHKGLPPGVIFALRNRNHAVNIEQQNRLHPYYLIYMAQDGTTVIPHTDVKRLLDLVRLACRGNAEPLAEVCRSFNTATDDGRDMRAYSALLDDAIRAMIDLKTEKDIDSLFSGGRTTALTHTIAGLDEFELIAFLVVQATA